MYRELQNQAGRDQWMNFFGSKGTFSETAINLNDAMQIYGKNSALKRLITRDNIHCFDFNGRFQFSSSGINKIDNVMGTDPSASPPDAKSIMSLANPYGDKLYTENIGNNLFKGLLRGQQIDKQNEIRWEKMNGGSDFFNYTRFPAVIHWQENKQGRASPVGYIVCYSSFQPTSGGDPTNSLLPHEPNWVQVKLAPDFQNGTQSANAVWIDNTLLGDLNASKSVIAALQNTSPMPDSYIYLYPDVEEHHRHSNTIFSNTAKHRIGGASLGMAVFGAVSGWSAAYYTGFVKYIMPGHEFENKTKYNEMMASAQLRTKMDDSYLDRGNTTSLPGNYQVTGQSIVKVVKQLNFVETIQDLPFKVVFAMKIGAPLIFPAFSEMGKSIEQALTQASNAQMMREWLNVMPMVYTMSMAQDAVPLKFGTANSSFAYSLFAGNTVTEFANLQVLASVGSMIGEFNNLKNNQDLQQFAGKWADDVVAKGQRQAQEQAPRLKQLREARQQFKETKNAPQYYASLARIKKQSAAKKSAKAEVKKQAAGKKKETMTQIRNKMKAAAEQYKQSYENAKASQNYIKMSKAQKQAFNREWKSPASVKKQMLKTTLLKFMQGGDLQRVHPRDPEAMREGLRKKLITTLITDHGLSEQAATNVAESSYGKRRVGAPPSFVLHPGSNSSGANQQPQQQQQSANRNGNDDDEDEGNYRDTFQDDDDDDETAQMKKYEEDWQSSMLNQAPALPRPSNLDKRSRKEKAELATKASIPNYAGYAMLSGVPLIGTRNPKIQKIDDIDRSINSGISTIKTNYFANKK